MQSKQSYLKDLAKRVLGPRAVQAIRTARAAPIVSRVAALAFPRAFESWHRRRTFQNVYENSRWGTEAGTKFYSGIGSRGEVVDVYVSNLALLLKKHMEELGRSITIVDLGCGDFTVGRELLERVPEASYIGCDIVPNLIQHHTTNYARPNVAFRRLDIVTDQLPDGDVCLIRQVLTHLPNADVSRVLTKLSQFPAVYITEGHPITLEGPPNPDKPIDGYARFDGASGRGRGLEFDKPPFNRQVEEICRFKSSPGEQVITFRVKC